MNVATQAMFRTALADGDEMLQAAQRLRYDVFVDELGAGGVMVDHARRLERDAFDEVCDHFLLIDDAVGKVVGVYRLIREAHAAEMGRFYSEAEFDLSRLKASGHRLLELGRSCLHPDYRGSAAMYHLWSGLARYVEAHGIGLLFGVASFPGTDAQTLSGPLSLLQRRHLAPEEMRPKVRAGQSLDLRVLEEDQFDRVQAMRDVPALIKGYLRLGGLVGEGAWLDHAFNTTDVCMVMDTSAMDARRRQIYSGTS